MLGLALVASKFDALGDGQIRYRMAENLATIGDAYFILSGEGRSVFQINGKALKTRDLLVFEDAQGGPLCQINGQAIADRDMVDVTGPDGECLASISRVQLTAVRDCFAIQLGADVLEVQGNVVLHEFQIKGGNGLIAEVSHRWFRARDTYGVDISAGQNDVVILAAIAGIDQMIRRVPTRGSKGP